MVAGKRRQDACLIGADDPGGYAQVANPQAPWSRMDVASNDKGGLLNVYAADGKTGLRQLTPAR